MMKIISNTAKGVTGKSLVVFSVMIISFLFISCEESTEEGRSECIEDCYKLCDLKSECELLSEDQLATCYDFCSSSKKSDWGELYSVAPLSCGVLEGCEELGYCDLFGGEKGYSCDGNSVKAEVPTNFSKDCEGLCKKAELCNHYMGYDSCEDYCKEDIQNGWVSDKVLECVGVLSCDRFSTCYYTLAYTNDVPDGDVPVDGDEVEPWPEIME